MFAGEDGDVEEGAVAVDFDSGTKRREEGRKRVECLVSGKLDRINGFVVGFLPVQLDTGHASEGPRHDGLGGIHGGCCGGGERPGLAV